MGKVRVAVDMTATCRDKLTGWERFALSLEKVLVAEENPDFEIFFPRFTKTTNGKYDYLVKQLIWHYYNARRSIPSVEIYHTGMLPPVKGNFKKTWTIHDDIIIGGHKEYARLGSNIWEKIALQSLPSTDKFITSTRYVADELVAIGVPSNKIEIIPPVINPLNGEAKEMKEFTDISGNKVKLSKKFALIVGSIEKRKNPVFAAQLALESNLTPVLVGGFSNLSARAFPHGTFFAGRCLDSELLWLYQNTEVLISSSFYEGVNLPIFEALNLGTKVIASEIGVHKELTNGLVTLFPLDFHEASKVLKRTLKNDFAGAVNLATSAEIAGRYYSLWESLK